MKYLSPLSAQTLILSSLILLGGCSSPEDGCDNILQTHYEYWVPILQETHADTVFHNARFPLDSTTYGGFNRTIQVSHDSTEQVEDPALLKLPLRNIRLTFGAYYTADAFSHWEADGFFRSSSMGVGFSSRQLHHEVSLQLPALVKGTYSFGPGDTADGLTADMRLRFRSGFNDYDFYPDSVEYTGYIRVDENFKANSGKFTYRVRARYLNGQVSVFTGTVLFKGYDHFEDCSM